MSLPKSSSGYQSLQDSPLARPMYHTQIIARGWPGDIIPAITCSEILQPLTSCYQVVNIMTEPDVGEWHDLELNQKLMPDQINADGFSMRICHAAYKAIKFDNQDIRMICDRWDDWEESFLNSAWNNLAAKWRCYVLDTMILQASACNKGCSAGPDGNINVGCSGQPRIITGDTIATELNKLLLLLKMSYRWVDGEMVLILHPAFRAALVTSPYASALEIGACCTDPNMLISGEMPGKLMGFNVFETTDVQSVVETGGRLAYYVIAAHRCAMAFVGDIIDSSVVQPTDYFGSVYRMAAIWGGEAIYPDGIAVGYWTLMV